MGTLSLYAVVVLLIPYRRAERWAWYLTFALPVHCSGLNNPEVARYYLAAAGLMVVSQLLTRSAFLAKDRG